jgi:hypothetical protein
MLLHESNGYRLKLAFNMRKYHMNMSGSQPNSHEVNHPPIPHEQLGKKTKGPPKSCVKTSMILVEAWWQCGKHIRFNQTTWCNCSTKTQSWSWKSFFFKNILGEVGGLFWNMIKGKGCLTKWLSCCTVAPSRLIPPDMFSTMWNCPQWLAVTEPPREGVRRQNQLKRFSVKREHNQHT